MSRSLIGAVRISLGLSSADFERKMTEADKKTQKFRKSIKRAAYQVDRSGKQLQQFGTSLAQNVSAPLAAVATGLAAATVKAADYADIIDKASIRTGISAERLQELRFAAGQLGVEFASIERSVDAFRRRMPQIVEGSGRAYDTFRQLGIQLNDTNGDIRQMDDLFDEMIRKLRGIENGNEQAAMAQQLFGRGASAMIPIFQATDEQFEALLNRSRELGIVMGQDSITEMVKFKDQMSEVMQQGGALSRELGLVMLPILRDDLIPFLQDTAVPALRDVAKWFAELDDGTKKTVLSLGAFTAAMGPAVYITGSFLRNLSAISKLMLTNPWGLAATGLAVFTGYLITASIRASELQRSVQAAVNAFDGSSFSTDDSLEELERHASVLENRMRDAGRTLSVQTLSDEQRSNIERELEMMSENLSNVRQLIDLKKQETAANEEAAESVDNMANSINRAHVEIKKVNDAMLDGQDDWLDLSNVTSDIDAIAEAWRILRPLSSDTAVSLGQVGDAISDLNTRINETFDEELRAKMIMQREELEEYRRILEGLGVTYAESFNTGIAAAQMFGSALANGMEAAVFQGERLQDILRNIMRQLASQVLRNLIMGGVAALFTGGTVGVSTLFTGAAVPMASGGTVPGGFPNDTYPAMLSSGETVIPSPLPLGTGSMNGGGYVPISVQIDGREIARSQAKLQRRRNA